MNAAIHHSMSRRFVAIAFADARQTGRALLGALVALLLASLIVACGGGSDGGTAQVPVLLTQPSDQSVIEGSGATFRVTADGAAPLAYQWTSSPDGTAFTPIAGATSASYSIDATATDNGMRYRVTVSNGAGSVTSSAVRLTVTQAIVAPAIATQPANQTVVAPATATFHVTASGTSLSYQWQRSSDGGASFSAIGASDAPSLAVSNTDAAQNGTLYQALVSNSAGSVMSAAAVLTVSPTPVAPMFTTQPPAWGLLAGQSVDITVAVAGTPTPTIQWRMSGVNLVDGANSACGAVVSGATTVTLSLAAVPIGCNNVLLDAVASNGVAPDATSNVAPLSVSPAPMAPFITTQPVDVTVAPPARATFTAAANGVPTPAVQWEQSGDGGSSWATITGATNTTYTTPATTPADDAKRLRAVFSNPTGSATSNPAVLTVTQPTTVGVGPAGGTVTGPNGAQAIVPAGALSTYVDIAIANAGVGAPAFAPPGVHPAGSIYAFTPHGTTFAQPVVVRVPFDPMLVPAGITPTLYQAEVGGAFTPIPGTTVDGSFLVASVSTFSYFGPGQSSARFSELSTRCAREALSGNVYCWGDQGNIAFGSGFAAPDAVGAFAEPTRLPPMSLTGIVTGPGFVCGLNVADVWCIGDDLITAASAVASPNARRAWAKILLPDGLVLFKLAAGGRHVCGIGAPNSPDQTAVGRVYCWGDDLRGQLGRGHFVGLSAVVAPIAGTQLYVALAASDNHTCAARQLSGDVDCWGDNSAGQVFNGVLPFQATATPMPRGLAVDPRQGALLPLCGLTVDGTAFCWGDNFYGQMGNGTAGTGLAGQNLRDPSAVPGLKFKSLSTGSTMCGIAVDDRAYCWGHATGGSLGNGSDTVNAGTANAGKQTTPVLVSVPEGVTFASITDADLGKCARTTDNVAYCWGQNNQYLLGIGINLPASVNTPNEIKDMNLAQEMP